MGESKTDKMGDTNKLNKDMDEFYNDDFGNYVIDLTPKIDDYLNKEIEYIKKSCRKDNIVLEVGCGSGRVLGIIANHVRMGIGIDYKEAQVKSSMKYLKEYNNIKIVQGDGRSMPLKDNIFDIVYMTFNTLGSFRDDKVILLKEMKRVTRKEGRIIFGLYAENAWLYQLQQYERWGFKKIEVTDKYVKVKNEKGVQIISERFSKKEIEKLINDTGLLGGVDKLNDFSYICDCHK